jgi:hypothetical protein
MQKFRYILFSSNKFFSIARLSALPSMFNWPKENKVCIKLLQKISGWLHDCLPNLDWLGQDVFWLDTCLKKAILLTLNNPPSRYYRDLVRKIKLLMVVGTVKMICTRLGFQYWYFPCDAWLPKNTCSHCCYMDLCVLNKSIFHICF